MMKSFRSGLFLTDVQLNEISRIMEELGGRVPARYLLLVDSSGQFVAEWGDRRESDPVSLGALMAGDVAATLEMARLLGENASFQMILREGIEESAFLADCGPHLVLLALVGRATPIGWARLLIRYTSDHLTRLSESDFTEESLPALDLSDENLKDLFDAELEELWVGGN